MAEQQKDGERSEGTGEDAEMMARLQEEIARLPVAEHLVYMLHSLSALAVGRLGLSADTKERRDLGQARLAIDAFKAILSVIEPTRPAGEVAAHRGMLSQLQLAYAGAIDGVETAAEAGEEPAAPPAPAEAGMDETPVTSKDKPARAKGTQTAAKKASRTGGSGRRGS